MALKKEDFEEFQRQLELQKSYDAESANKPTTKVDDDGTVYEWDEGKKAWFPSLSVDVMQQYQSTYNSNENSGTAAKEDDSKQQKGSDSSSFYLDPLTKTKYVWDKSSEKWVQESSPQQQNVKLNGDTYEYTDPKTKEVYKWNATSQQWYPSSVSIQGNNSATYTDPKTNIVYKWNAEKSLWVSDDGDELIPNTGNAQTSAQDDKFKRQWGEISDTDPNTKNTKPNNKGKGNKKRAAPKKTKPEWFNIEKEKNTKVYVTGLPHDITMIEFKELMEKCGLIMPNAQNNEPKLKLYTDSEGNYKGDGLCCYLKRESIALSIQILDGTDLRGSTIHIEEAEFKMKGEFDPSKKPKMLSKKEKQKALKQQEKMLDWKLNRKEEAVSKSDRVVILKNMFDVNEFEEDPVAITEIKEDLKVECEKFGIVKKVIVFDRHPDGVCSVAFKTAEGASKCQASLNGRWFGGKSVVASIWDGNTDYQIEETDREREERLKKWENYLDSSGTPNNDEQSVSSSNTETKTSDVTKSES